MYAESREEKLVNDFENLRNTLNNIEENICDFKKQLQEISGQNIRKFDFDLNSQIDTLLCSLSNTIDDLEQSKYSKMVIGLVPIDSPADSQLFIDRFPKEIVEHYSKICPECNIRVFKRLPVCICGHTFDFDPNSVSDKHKRKHSHALKYDPTLL